MLTAHTRRSLEIWIGFTLLAAFMQAVRTAGQKKLSVHLNAMATTGVRYLYALPFAVLYLVFLLEYRQQSIPELNPQFLQYALIACVMQIIGIACLVAAFKYGNFAVATSLAKTEAIQVAIVAALVFSVSMSFLGWLSVVGCRLLLALSALLFYQRSSLLQKIYCKTQVLVLA